MNKTQAWLAEAAQVSSTAAHLWIRKGEISLDKALVVADLLQVSLDELFGREGKQGRETKKDKMELVWVNEVELDLLTRFRNTDEMGRKLITMAGAGAPQLEEPASSETRE